MQEESNKPSLPAENICTFTETERTLLIRTLSATPAQRLAWLEEALKFAYRAGAIPSKITSHNQSKLD